MIAHTETVAPFTLFARTSTASESLATHDGTGRDGNDWRVERESRGEPFLIQNWLSGSGIL